MRAVPVVVAGLLLSIATAHAQVTTNDSALDQLAAPRAATRPASRSTSHSKPHAAPAHSTSPHPATSTATTATSTPVKPGKPPISATPPAILALPAAIAVPLAHPPPAPTVPLADDAPGDVTPLQNGMRVTFGTGRSDFTPATADALATFAAKLVAPSTASINIYAYAAGSPDDPSTPRRLSLQRALAARAVLMKAGIASPRIYPRALGPTGGDDAPDRVDVVTGAPTPTSGPSSGPSSGPGPAG